MLWIKDLVGKCNAHNQTLTESNHRRFWTSDRANLSTESGSGPIQLARAPGRTDHRAVAESPPYCMNALQHTLQAKKARKNSEKWEYTLDVQFLLFSASMIAQKEQLSLQQTSTRCLPMMKVKGSWFFSWLSTTGSISMSLWRRTTSQSSEWMTKWQCSSPYIKLR